MNNPGYVAYSGLIIEQRAGGVVLDFLYLGVVSNLPNPDLSVRSCLPSSGCYGSVRPGIRLGVLPRE